MFPNLNHLASFGMFWTFSYIPWIWGYPLMLSLDVVFGIVSWYGLSLWYCLLMLSLHVVPWSCRTLIISWVSNPLMLTPDTLSWSCPLALLIGAIPWCLPLSLVRGLLSPYISSPLFGHHHIICCFDILFAFCFNVLKFKNIMLNGVLSSLEHKSSPPCSFSDFPQTKNTIPLPPPLFTALNPQAR